MSNRKVDFFIVGAAKAGTTSLFDSLASNPDIFLPGDKEPHFFGDMKPRGKRDLYLNYDAYIELFRGANDAQILGEASTGYLYSSTAAQELYRHNPEAKIIISLRDPVSRAYSLYWHHIRDYKEQVSFEEALALEEKRIAEKDGFGFHYLKSGLYFEQVKRYIDVFGRDQVKILIFENFKNQYPSIVEEVCQFLGVEKSFSYNKTASNKSGLHKNEFIGRLFSSDNVFRKTLKAILPGSFRKLRTKIVQANLVKAPEMAESTRSTLIEYFEKDIELLERLIEKDLVQWKRN